MNPEDPKESNLSTLSPYPVRASANGSRVFDTDRGITYQLAFASETKSYPSSPFAENLVTFAIVPLKGYTKKVFFRERVDLRIELTIMGELQALFKLNPFLVIAYTCDTTENLERHRSIVFKKWYRKYLQALNVTHVTYQGPGTRTYGGILFSEDNPYKEDIEAEFNFQLSGK